MMRFRIQHLMLIVAVYAMFLASGFPGTLLTPRPVWQIVSVHQQDHDASDSLAAHTSHGHAGAGRDYIATVQHGRRTRTINFGDTAVINQHRLQLPEVGSHVVTKRQTAVRHGELPIEPVDAPSMFWSVLPAIFSLLCSVAFVIGGITFRRFFRWQILLHRERRMIDRAIRTGMSS